MLITGTSRQPSTLQSRTPGGTATRLNVASLTTPQCLGVLSVSGLGGTPTVSSGRVKEKEGRHAYFHPSIVSPAGGAATKPLREAGSDGWVSGCLHPWGSHGTIPGPTVGCQGTRALGEATAGTPDAEPTPVTPGILSGGSECVSKAPVSLELRNPFPFSGLPRGRRESGAGGARVPHTHPGDPMALGNLQILSAFQLYEQLYVHITCCLGEFPWWLRG